VFLVHLRKRLGGSSEAGFTLVELLIVMLILGILASIALPAFFTQRSKASDAEAKEYAHTAQVSIEAYATSNSGRYEGLTEAKLKELEPTLKNAGTITVNGPAGTGSPTSSGYQVSIASTTGNVFAVRNTSGTITFPCTVPAGTTDRGGCPGTGTSGTWG
jgi:prepilin-type N-terminal cleavage/methylation domain-containing protein